MDTNERDSEGEVLETGFILNSLKAFKMSSASRVQLSC